MTAELQIDVQCPHCEAMLELVVNVTTQVLGKRGWEFVPSEYHVACPEGCEIETDYEEN